MIARHTTPALLTLLLLVPLVLLPTQAQAAPQYPPLGICTEGTFEQHDMAGRYENQTMLLDMTPCGPMLLTWSNRFGEHTAMYISTERIPGGGVLATGFLPDPDIKAFLDSAPMILVKPAERGYIQIASVTPDYRIDTVYHLMKTGY